MKIIKIDDWAYIGDFAEHSLNKTIVFATRETAKHFTDKEAYKIKEKLHTAHEVTLEDVEEEATDNKESTQTVKNLKHKTDNLKSDMDHLIQSYSNLTAFIESLSTNPETRCQKIKKADVHFHYAQYHIEQAQREIDDILKTLE